MLDAAERQEALVKMEAAKDQFYQQAIQIGVHPFIEFAGLMSEYIRACHDAHQECLDFSECNAHSGKTLPLAPYRSDYINEKLECIFTGAKAIDGEPTRDHA